jgi:hypothetical protein
MAMHARIDAATRAVKHWSPGPVAQLRLTQDLAGLEVDPGRAPVPPGDATATLRAKLDDVVADETIPGKLRDLFQEWRKLLRGGFP